MCYAIISFIYDKFTNTILMQILFLAITLSSNKHVLKLTLVLSYRDYLHAKFIDLWRSKYEISNYSTKRLSISSETCLRLGITLKYRHRFILLKMILFLVVLLAMSCNGDISEETKKLVSDWAPLVWIHPEDPFLPSNVDFYLDSMEVITLKSNCLI